MIVNMNDEVRGIPVAIQVRGTLALLADAKNQHAAVTDGATHGQAEVPGLTRSDFV